MLFSTTKLIKCAYTKETNEEVNVVHILDIIIKFLAEIMIKIFSTFHKCSKVKCEY